MAQEVVNPLGEAPRSSLVVIAPIPPPLNGQTLIAKKLLERLHERGLLCVVVDTSHSIVADWKALLRRLTRLAFAPVVIVRQRWRGTRRLYMSALVNKGLYHTTICSLLARLLGYEIIIRHGSSSYTKRRMLKMQLLAVCAGRSALHVTLAKEMSTDLMSQYPNIRTTFVLNNAFAVDTLGHPLEKAESNILHLGHLSNLSKEKGLERALCVLRLLLSVGIPARLTLAGSVNEKGDRDIVFQSREEFGENIHYIGSVTGAEKARFFSHIDVFLFPSLHRYEAQPNVCLEAMAAGVPVMAYDWGYVSETLRGGGGIVLDPAADFATQALPVLVCWNADRAKLRAASQRAHQHFLDLRGESKGQLDHLLALLDS